MIICVIYGERVLIQLLLLTLLKYLIFPGLIGIQRFIIIDTFCPWPVFKWKYVLLLCPFIPFFSSVFTFPDNWQTNRFAQTDPAINGTTPRVAYHWP